MAGFKSRARAAALRESPEEMLARADRDRSLPISGHEITVGGSQHRNATPRIVGSDNVRAYKEKMGVCTAEGCRKIAGHGGDHT